MDAGLRRSDDEPRDHAGVAELEVGGELEPHWHATDEVYHVVGGIGEVLLDDTWHPVEPGSTLFIPGNVRHAIRNAATR